jgi:hypothetical protein
VTPEPWGPPGGDGGREWVLRRDEPPRPGRGVAFAALVWLPGALFLLGWETHTLVTRSWPVAVNLTSLVAVLAAGWTGLGVHVLRPHLEGHRGDVVTATRDRLRAERITREGRRPRFEVGYADLRDLHADGDGLRLETADGDKQLPGTGTPAQRDEIVRHVRARLAPPAGGVRPPVVAGWRAYLDDRGPTLGSDGASRRRDARWCAGGALVAAVNGAASAAGGNPVLAAFSLVATALLARVAFRWFRTTPRWTAMRGAVVRIDRPGGEPVFRARSMELLDRKDDEGGVTTTLWAVADPVGHSGSARQCVLLAGRDGDHLARAALWLTGAAGISCYDLREHRT